VHKNSLAHYYRLIVMLL